MTLFMVTAMIRREIELDEESDRILSGLAQKYDPCEAAHHDSLIAQKERERGFQEGRFTTWEEVKRGARSGVAAIIPAGMRQA